MFLRNLYPILYHDNEEILWLKRKLSDKVKKKRKKKRLCVCHAQGSRMQAHSEHATATHPTRVASVVT